uniref:Amiloride-sensitive sodium channel n=1 Tax=Panagrellus redivivus TaxID=6233 RepID=A0A7E4UQ96_PANRE
MIFQTVNIFFKYFAYPSAIITALDYGSIPFPEVTICNSNPLRFDYVTDGKNGDFKDIYKWANQYSSMLSSNWGDITPDDYGINKGVDRYDKTLRGRETIVLLMAQLTESQLEKASYTPSSIVRNCNFNNAECHANDFKTYYDATYSACFTFNYDGKFETQRAGSNFGLHFLMLVNQMNPKGQRLFLPTTDAAGAYIAIQPQGGDPAMETFGIGAPVGQNTQIGLTYTKISRLKEPYGSCVDNETEVNEFYPGITYTYDLCIRVCRQKYIYSKIGCADPRYGMLGNMSKCGFSSLDALLSLRDYQNPASPAYWNPETECDCKLPCSETTISTTFTLARAPSNRYTVMNSKYVPTTYNCYTTSNFPNANACITWYQQNSVVVSVYFETFDYLSLKETATYTTSTMLNEFGGQLGLWLGFSIITIFEILCLIVMMCLYAVVGSRIVRKVNPESADDDWRIVDVKGLREELDNHEHLNREQAKMQQMRLRSNATTTHS